MYLDKIAECEAEENDPNEQGQAREKAGSDRQKQDQLYVAVHCSIATL